MFLTLIAALSCPSPFDDLVTGLGPEAVILAPADVARLPIEGATRAFIIPQPDGSVLIGVEKDGCTLPPLKVRYV